jgi:LPS export ABC transporter protein LptC
MPRFLQLLVCIAWLCAAAADAREGRKGAPAKAEIETARRVEVPLFDPKTGKRTAVLRAAKVTPDPQNAQRLLANDVEIVFFQDGKNHTAAGQTGIIDMTERTAYLRGDVVVVFEDAVEVEDRTHVYTDDLLWEGAKGTATTEGPVNVERPDVTVTGVGMTVFRNSETEQEKGAPPAKGAAPEKGVPAEKAAKLGEEAVPAKGAPPKPQGAEQTGYAIIHRHEKTVIRPGKGQWLMGVPGGGKPAVEAPTRPPTEPAAKNGKEAPKADAPAAPIVITSRGPLRIDRLTRMAHYEKDVRAVQDRQTLTADDLTITFQPEKSEDPEAAAEKEKGKEAKAGTEAEKGTVPKVAADAAKGSRSKAAIDRVVAVGHVRMDDGSTFALADQAVWTQANGNFVLTGCPAEVRWDNGNRMAAGSIQRLQNGEVLTGSVTKEHPRLVSIFVQAVREQPAEPEAGDAPKGTKPAPAPPATLGPPANAPHPKKPPVPARP